MHERHASTHMPVGERAEAERSSLLPPWLPPCRSLGQFQGLLEYKAGALPVPDVLITAVGTKIWRLDVQVGRAGCGGGHVLCCRLCTGGRQAALARRCMGIEVLPLPDSMPTDPLRLHPTGLAGRHARNCHRHCVAGGPPVGAHAG